MQTWQSNSGARKRGALAAVFMMIVAAADPASAWARDHHNRDSEFARGALQRGEVLPIGSLLSLASQYLPGDVVELRLEPRRSGDLFYRIKVLTPSGQIRDLVLDARTGKFIGIED